MKLEKIWAIYFSGTGTTRRTVERIAGGIASRLNLPAESVDFSRPAVRQETLGFGEMDLVVFGTPVYAGRVPNVLLPFLQERIVGGGALAVPVVLFGNRNYDDALIELRNILAADGMHPIAAGAFVGEHSFSRVLGADRSPPAVLSGLGAADGWRLWRVVAGRQLSHHGVWQADL